MVGVITKHSFEGKWFGDNTDHKGKFADYYYKICHPEPVEGLSKYLDVVSIGPSGFIQIKPRN
ncbi:MAG: hypothetical protein EOO90_31385 [Pedobacter sp.]|nr:MAG: hypothetical protein EOO90_31385 [Pedobacter sp.]